MWPAAESISQCGVEPVAFLTGHKRRDGMTVPVLSHYFTEVPRLAGIVRKYIFPG